MSKKIFAKVTLVVALTAVTVFTSSVARADRCSAEAQFVKNWSVKDGFKYKVKFNVSAASCDEYSCRGYIHYRVHYTWRSGGGNSHTTLSRYTVPKGDSSAEVVDEVIASSMLYDIDDIEITEVSCSTP